MMALQGPEFLNKPTLAMLYQENLYEEWRVVSMRVVPCQPMGIMPSQDPDVCVGCPASIEWQPVVRTQASWGTVD